MASKVGCFAGFWHHHLMIMSVYIHACCYPLKLEQKQVSEQSLYVEKIKLALLRKHKEQQKNTLFLQQ